jgi:hypothetical protein
MRAASTLLLILALALGTLAASTAYLVPLSLPDEELTGLKLGGPAGMMEGESGKPTPIAGKGAEITPELLARLRANGVEYVRVGSFAWSRWPWRWWFVLAGAGLIGAAALARRAARHVPGAGTAGGPVAVPGAQLREIREVVRELNRTLPEMVEPESRLKVILARVGEVQATELPAFVEDRPRLVAELGLGGYAELMDRFAAAERQLNRAWSAAADGVYGEAYACLRQAEQHLDEAIERLP